MGKVVYSMGVSLDGYFEGPNHELDWHIVDDELQNFVMARERARGAYLWGRRVYEHMGAYWSAADQVPSASAFVRDYARIWRDTPKIVFSRTLEHVEPNARLVREVTPETVASLKSEFDSDLSIGGADLASTFVRLGLIDEYGLFVEPVILGRGAAFFPVLEQPVNLHLVATHQFGSGIVYLQYEPAGSRE